jgi:hypothetical protein
MAFSTLRMDHELSDSLFSNGHRGRGKFASHSAFRLHSGLTLRRTVGSRWGWQPEFWQEFVLVRQPCVKLPGENSQA